MDKRPRLSRPQCAQDWEGRKDIIIQLYESKTLKETMRIMEEEHLFKATEKQYKTQLQKWDIDHKRIKPTEYKAMVRKKRQREEDGQKDSKFELRGLEVDDAKIIRFQKRHRISEPEQLYDCPTPPDLICTTPAAVSISSSPDPRSFPWYDIYERYLDLSMAGAPTVQSNDVRIILRWLTVQFDDDKAQCQFSKDRESKSYGFATEQESVPSRRNLILLGEMLILTLCVRIWKMNEIYRSRRRGTVASKCVGTLENGDHSLPASDPIGQLVVLWAVKIASTMCREHGQRDKAISLLETVRNLFGPNMDLKDATIRLFYNDVLIDLACCCAADGHHNEATDLLENKVEFPSSLRCRGRFQKELFGSLELMLQGSREHALHFVGELENGRGGTRSRQEHHGRLKERSSQPEVLEWGPFLTDCIEWDKI